MFAAQQPLVKEVKEPKRTSMKIPGGPGKDIESQLRQLEKKKFGDDMLAELAHMRFQEAKKRLRNFVINTDMMSDLDEKRRLISFFQHRPYTLITILKEAFKARKTSGAKSQKKVMIDEKGGCDADTQKVFKLVNTKSKSENLSQEQVDARAQEAIERFQKENGLSPSTKLYVVLGVYNDVRKAMAAQDGWFENPIDNFENPSDYRVHAFHFAYTTKSRDAFKYQTATFQ